MKVIQYCLPHSMSPNHPDEREKGKILFIQTHRLVHFQWRFKIFIQSLCPFSKKWIFLLHPLRDSALLNASASTEKRISGREIVPADELLNG